MLDIFFIEERDALRRIITFLNLPNEYKQKKRHKTINFEIRTVHVGNL